MTARAPLVFGAGIVAALALLAAVVAFRPPVPGDAALAMVLDRILLWQSLLPRAAVALLAGAALGLAGALLQRILRNPIADPSTLGITAGAQLALTLATAFAPGLVALSREGVALAGGLAAVAIVLALSWRRGLDPVTVILSGMMLSLVASALSVTVVLAKGDYVMSLFIWGAGALDQQGWGPAITLALHLAAGGIAAGLMLRPLALLGLGDTAARGLGLAVQTFRLLALLVAVWLAAAVTAEVGIIAFVGLAAPAFARFCGARRPDAVLALSPLAGALILSLTDSAIRLSSGGFGDIAPTGAATALLGGPVLLWLLRGVHGGRRQPADATPAGRRLASPARTLALLASVAALLLLGGLVAGRDAGGWHVATGGLFLDLLPFRAPRLIVAAAAGAMLAAAGTLLQRMTGNPMASPEVMGISAGGGVGLAAVLFLAGFPDPPTMIAGMAIGTLATLGIVLAIGARSGFGPERLLLSGVALGAFGMSVLTTVLAGGGMRGYMLLAWLSGSTNDAGPVEAWTGAIAAALLIAPLPFLGRWLDLLPLGDAIGTSLGLAVRRTRLVLAIVAALLTAVASLLVGPLSLVGLVAPHLARLTGFGRGRDQLAAAVLIGASLLVLADWFSRVVIFPYQVPLGLFASLVGGPYLLWLLNRGGNRHG